jgi:hypothetical protein
MSLLNTIQKGKRQTPPRLLIYGIEGVGKSTLGASAPNPIFISTEDGLDRIDCDSFPLCRSFEEMMACLKTLREEKHNYQTLVIDSLDWAEKLVFAHVCKQFGAKSIEKVDGGYGKGFEHALTYWSQMIDAFRPLRDEKGMIMILIAHAKIERHNDPESAEFDRFSPKLHKKANALWCEWCDAILLATREFGAARGEKSGGRRILRCVPSATCNAKNRYGLPEIMPLEWGPLMEYFVNEN